MKAVLDSLADLYRRRLRRFYIVRVPKFVVWWLVWFVRWKLIYGVRGVLWPRVKWFLRWHVIYPVTGQLVPRVTHFVRWRLIHPALGSALPRALWFLRWRVARPLARRLLPGAILRGYHRLRGMGLMGIWMQPRVPLLPLISQSQARQNSKVPSTVIFPAAMMTCAQPAVFPKRLAKAVPALQGAHPFPAVVRTTFRNAEVVGRSNMVVADGAVIHHDLYRFSHDFTSEELHGKIRIYPFRPAVKRYASPPMERRFEHAAVFTDSCAPNYAHWLTEVLPRIHAYVESGPASGSTVLIDAGLHPNLVASAELMLGGGVVLEELGQGCGAHIEQIEVVSPGGYIPFDRRPGATRGHSHGVFSGPALLSMRGHLAARLGPPLRRPPPKILLRRNSTGRAMKNEQELEDRLALLGFVPVYPERLTFAEQYHLFSNAEVVVGATGAAMASLIFCPPETHVIICLSAHPKHSYGYWQGMAAAVGNTVTYVLGPLDGPRSAGIHADFSIDVEDVFEAIRSRTRAAPVSAHPEALPELN